MVYKYSRLKMDRCLKDSNSKRRRRVPNFCQNGGSEIATVCFSIRRFSWRQFVTCFIFDADD